MNRSDLLDENYLVRALGGLKSDLDEFAGHQPVSGRSGIVTYAGVAGSGWDFVATIGSDAETNMNRLTTVTVDFTGDGSQQFPNEECFASIYCNGTDAAAKPTLRVDGTYAWDGTGGRFIILHDWGVSQPDYWSDPLRYRWTFVFESHLAVTIYFKAVAGGTSPGSLSVSRVTL